MTNTPELRIARAKHDLCIVPRMANRHGLIAGATARARPSRSACSPSSSVGSASRCSWPTPRAIYPAWRVPVATTQDRRTRQQLGLTDFEYDSVPVVFWDVLGEAGPPGAGDGLRHGPLAPRTHADLNDTQAGVLTLTFKVADDNGLLLLDLKDLRAMLEQSATNAAQFRARYGNVSTTSIGAIQRGLLALEGQGGERFFGEPALELDDLLQTDGDGHGVVNILGPDKLMQTPKLYSTFLLWMLSELFEQLPEVGDLDNEARVLLRRSAPVVRRHAGALETRSSRWSA